MDFDMSSDKKLFTDFPPVSREEWEKVIQKDLRGADYKNKLNWQTGEGIRVLPFYQQDDFDQLPEPLSTPRDWEVRQRVDEQDIAAANEIARRALARGADGITFALQIAPKSGDLGRDLHGTAIQDQQAFNRLLEGINLSEHAIHFDTPTTSPAIIAMLHNFCETEGLDPATIYGSVLDDPYAIAITHGSFPANEEMLREHKKQVAAFCSSNLSHIKSLGINARVYHNTGATIIQEVGCALATGSEYLATMQEAGVNINTVASAIHFNFSIGSYYFLEIAKLRVLRKLWSGVLRAYDAKDQPAYIHATSSDWNKTVYDPYVNMLRTTTEGMSAAIAGCDALTIQPFDASFREPDSFSSRIARNSQTILKEEAYFNKVSDAAAGSYYIEQLTDKIGEAAWSCFQEIEQQGGMMKSIREGYLQATLEESRNQRDQAISTRQRVFVGINQYPNPGDSNPEKETDVSVVSLKKSDTDFSIVRDKLVSSIKKALQNGATLGDLMPSISVTGKMEIRTIRPYRGAEAFEELRQATENHSYIPTVLLLPMGNKRARKGRSTFAANFFGCAGYKIEDPLGFETCSEAVEAIRDQQPDVVVLCSSDNEYSELIAELGGQLNQLKEKPVVVLAGYPKEHIETFKKAGVEAFIHAKSNVLETLKEFHRRLGIIDNDK